MEEEKLLKFMFWIRKNCTPRTTSRFNVYAEYWQLKETVQLFTDKELISHWTNFVYKP